MDWPFESISLQNKLTNIVYELLHEESTRYCHRAFEFLVLMSSVAFYRFRFLQVDPWLAADICSKSESLTKTYLSALIYATILPSGMIFFFIGSKSAYMSKIFDHLQKKSILRRDSRAYIPKHNSIFR